MNEKKYCCSAMGCAANQGLIVEKNNEYLIVPPDPNANKTMALNYCPFCRTRLMITVGCKKSPDGQHCWHTMPCGEVFIPSGTSQATIICCWCGETQTVELPTTSYIANIKDHGEHFKIEVHYEKQP